MLVVEYYSQTYTVAANNVTSPIDVACTKTGYTPIAIAGFASGNNNVVMVRALLGGTTARSYLRNVSGSAITGTYEFSVLFLKQ